MSQATRKPPTAKAWDPLIRVFHWSLVFFFLLAYVSGDDASTVHVWSGYIVAGLIGLRLVWGVIGTRNARFYSFVKSPAAVRRHLRQMLSRNPPHYLGHNPVAAVMVIALLASIALTAFSGMVLIAGDGQGPLAGTLLAALSGDTIEELHEFFANFTVLLVLAHLSGVVISSFLEGENLVKAMITGRKIAREYWADAGTDAEQGGKG